jgi:hypothetical protein
VAQEITGDLDVPEALAEIAVVGGTEFTHASQTKVDRARLQGLAGCRLGAIGWNAAARRLQSSDAVFRSFVVDRLTLLW